MDRSQQRAADQRLLLGNLDEMILRIEESPRFLQAIEPLAADVEALVLKLGYGQGPDSTWVPVRIRSPFAEATSLAEVSAEAVVTVCDPLGPDTADIETVCVNWLADEDPPDLRQDVLVALNRWRRVVAAEIEVQGSAEATPGNKRRHRTEWVAQAMLLVQEHPDWPDAKIAREIGVDPSQLVVKRCPEYQRAASMSRRTGRVRPGTVSVDPDTGERTLEAEDD